MEIKKDIQYPYLPNNVLIEYVSEENYFMAEAKKMAQKSNDLQQPTGAVIVVDGKIISQNSNKNPLKNSFLIKLHKKYCLRHLLKIPSGQKYYLCPGCATNSSHAEYRAVLEIQRKNIQNLNNPVLYLWGHWWCCQPCWQKMLETGIQKVFLLNESEVLFNLKNPKNILGKQFLEENKN